MELLQQAVESEHVLVTCARQETEDESGAERRIPGMGEQTRFPCEKSEAEEPEWETQREDPEHTGNRTEETDGGIYPF